MNRGNRKEIKKLVTYILHYFPHTRDSDTDLAIKLWQEFYPQHFEGNMMDVQALHELPSIKTISRVRRDVQNREGRYLPTKWEVAKKRKIAQDEWKEWAREQKKAERPSLFGT